MEARRRRRLDARNSHSSASAELCDLGTGGSQTANLHQHIDDGLGHEAGNGRAAKMLDATDESGRKAGPQVLSFLPKQFGPAHIVRDNGNFLADRLPHTFFQGAHLRRNAGVKPSAISFQPSMGTFAPFYRA